MRLIDAEQFEGRYFIGEGEIEKAPTVEAIPIEWIKKYIAEEGIYPNRELLSVEQADAIEKMIENWEKENDNKK